MTPRDIDISLAFNEFINGLARIQFSIASVVRASEWVVSEEGGPTKSSLYLILRVECRS